MSESLHHKMECLGIVVIIPTYNNQRTLQRVLDGVLTYGSHVIVVNDGSTDGTVDILAQYADINVIHFVQNKGKGMALRAGFELAKKMGYRYAISIDSDGQHYPSDLPLFVEELEKHKDPVLLIGSRNMAHDSVPKKSSFGNRFSNFWFWFETGIKLTDTQSGYRLYPLAALPTSYYSTKFEFEIEVIVRTAWNGIVVKNVPIQVLYDPEERVSHFRPFRDFARISVVNLVLVFLTFFYIAPRQFLRSFKKKRLSDFVKENVFGSEDSVEKKAVSIGFGVFMGIAPVWGFQTALVISLSVFLRLNKVLSFAFSNISIPPFIPFIIYASLIVGGLVLPSGTYQHTFRLDEISFSTIQTHFVQYVVGSFMLAFLAAVSAGVTSYMWIKFRNNKTVSAE